MCPNRIQVLNFTVLSFYHDVIKYKNYHNNLTYIYNFKYQLKYLLKLNSYNYVLGISITETYNSYCTNYSQL